MQQPFAIFDMDGTLVNSMPCWRGLGAEYLRAQGLEAPSAAVLEELRPLTTTESAAWLVQRFALPCTPQQVVTALCALMETHYRQDLCLKPGVAAYLAALHRRGVRMCVASATPEPLVRLCLERLGVLPYFEFVLSCETLGVTKREPTIYREAAARFGAPPAQIAVYEDALYAAQTAKQAGFYLVGVYDAEADHHWAALRDLADEVLFFA